MVLNHWSRRCDLVGRISGTSFFIVILVIIKSSPETIKQIRYLLNYEVSNSKATKVSAEMGLLSLLKLQCQFYALRLLPVVCLCYLLRFCSRRGHHSLLFSGSPWTIRYRKHLVKHRLSLLLFVPFILLVCLRPRHHISHELFFSSLTPQGDLLEQILQIV